MSRSKHTLPRRIRAVRRIRAPFAPRREGDRRSQWVFAAMLKQAGMVPAVVEESRGRSAPRAPRSPEAPEAPAPLPRIRVSRPRQGYVHPAGRADVERVLHFFGAQCFYGIRSIELVQGVARRTSGRFVFGTLSVPGRVRLYDQLPSPWLLPGSLAPNRQAQLRGAGAIVEVAGQGSQTLVTWPGDTLRDFMLFDVLMHEIGHHMIQQYTGKRLARVARTSDHEAFAERFARDCRSAYLRSTGAGGDGASGRATP